MNYAEWEQQVPDAICQKSLRDFLAYRKALFPFAIRNLHQDSRF